MQYLLTHEEMQHHQERMRIADKLPSLELLNKTCERLACTVVVNPHGTQVTHGCIHSKEKRCYYCDKCPVMDICRMPKNFSK